MSKESKKSLIDRASDESASVRESALEEFAALDLEAQQSYLAGFLRSPYRDVREGVLELVEGDSWTGALRSLINSSPSREPEICIGVLALLARGDGRLPQEFVQFGEYCVAEGNEDVQYQALCFLERQNREGADYVATLRRMADSSDAEIRMVAVQGIARLRPEWGLEVLTQLARKAAGYEAFHILLARMELGGPELRRELEPELIRRLYDGRFCYPAVVALNQYGSSEAVTPLLDVAGSLFGEPTLRIAAAEAAGMLGSEKAVEMLTKFMKRSANRDYAREALNRVQERMSAGAGKNDTYNRQDVCNDVKNV